MRSISFSLIFCVLTLTSTEMINNQEVKFFKKIYNLSNPSQKQIFEKWELTNLKDIPNDFIAQRYNKSKNTNKYDKKLGTWQYEDDKYAVFSQCRGEYGGETIFYEKKTGKIYKTDVTCFKMINYQDGHYYILSSLEHLSGKMELIVIENPQDLADRNKKGYKTLFFSYGIMANIFFQYEKDIYLIYSISNKTFLGKLVNDELVYVAELLDFELWGDSNAKIKNGIYASSIKRSSIEINKGYRISESVKGTIYIKQDTILIGYKRVIRKSKSLF